MTAPAARIRAIEKHFGGIRLIRIIEDLKKYKNHIWYTAKSQLKAEVANSKLGWIWWVLEPFSFMFIYAFVYGVVFDSKEENMPLFIFIGITMFKFFTGVMKKSARMVKHNRDIIGKVYMPKYMLIVESILVNGFKMVVCFLIVIPMLFFYRISITWHIIFMIPVLVILVLFTFGICCFILHAGVYLEDLTNILDIVVRLLRYLTGVFYSILKKLPYPMNIIASRWNPVALLITSARNILVYHEELDYYTLAFWGILSVVIACAGVQLIYNNENSYIKAV